MTDSAIPSFTQDRDLLIHVYDAFNHRDIDAILPVMHPEVEWPNGMEGGWVQGREGVRAYWTRQWKMIDPHVEPKGFENEPDGRVIVHVHQIVRDLNGALLLDRLVQHVYRIEGGLIQRMDIRE
jgi:nuclear transport factor 2 (NTF2) superfamily protein